MWLYFLILIMMQPGTYLTKGLALLKQADTTHAKKANVSKFVTVVAAKGIKSPELNIFRFPNNN